MKRTVVKLGLLSVVALLLCHQSVTEVSGQSQTVCPVVKVICPDQISQTSELVFTVELTGWDSATTPTYNWSISSGTISRGQGTARLYTDIKGLGGQTITATVDVGGYKVGCSVFDSCTTSIVMQPESVKVDVLGQPRPTDENQRLDNFALALMQDPTAQGYIIVYGGRITERKDEAQAAADKAKNYLVENRQIDRTRVVTVDGGYRENLSVELWIVPNQAVPPTATPTVDPSEVKIVQPTRKPPAKKPTTRRKKP